MIDFKALLGQGNPPLVGIDISTTSRAAGGAGAGRQGRIPAGALRRRTAAAQRCHRRQYREHGPGGGAVRRVWKKSGTRARHVALGMPPASVITKKIILPAGLPEDQLEVQVESEASQYIPFALDEVSLDFDVIGPAANSADDIEVMLAASRREKSRTGWRLPKRPASRPP
jgi:type IV pilus assembly protein PilM